MRRAAISVAANSAEGCSRQYLKEYLQFLHMADASFSEVAYYIHLARRLDLTDDPTTKRLEALRSDAGRPLYGLIDWVKGQVKSGVVLNVRISGIPTPYVTQCAPAVGDWRLATGNPS